MWAWMVGDRMSGCWDWLVDREQAVLTLQYYPWITIVLRCYWLISLDSVWLGYGWNMTPFLCMQSSQLINLEMLGGGMLWPSSCACWHVLRCFQCGCGQLDVVTPPPPSSVSTNNSWDAGASLVGVLWPPFCASWQFLLWGGGGFWPPFCAI